MLIGDTITTPAGRGMLQEIDYCHGFALVYVPGRGLYSFTLADIGEILTRCVANNVQRYLRRRGDVVEILTRRVANNVQRYLRRRGDVVEILTIREG